MKRFQLLILLLSFAGMATAASIPQNPILSRYVVPHPSDKTMRAIAARWEVERPDGNGYVVIVPTKDAAQLTALAPSAKLVDADITATLLKHVGYARSGWHNFKTMQSHLDDLAKQYPKLVSVEQYGQTMEGRPLKAMHLKSDVNVGHDKPQLVITGATHGNELITVEVVLGLADKLVKGYGTDARLTKMVDNHDLYFIPVVNPDGYVRMERYCNGIDPNRNYPWPEEPNRDSNPTIKAIMNFFAQHKIAGSIDYHSAAAMVMYPWAWTYDSIATDDARDLDQLTTKMASSNGYAHGPIASTIYIAPGSSADYYYWKFHTRAVAVEISQDGSSSLIPSMLEENTESTWTFIESF